MTIYRAIGLMSGTSADGIDICMIEASKDKIHEIYKGEYFPYSLEIITRIKRLYNNLENLSLVEFARLERDITILHVNAVNNYLKNMNISNKDIDIIGFHGQALYHAPKENISIQIGNGSLLSELTGINVINDFRRRDIAAGGNGAPLIPIYHIALARSLKKPVAFLNIGGVANITLIGEKEGIAFDTGPGNGLIDDLIFEETNYPFDRNGEIAAKGKLNEKILEELLRDPFFALPAPKSLDRNYFVKDLVKKLSLNDAACTLTHFTAKSIMLGINSNPIKPKEIIVAGGGRKNQFLMKLIGEYTKIKVKPIDEYDFDGDMIEAAGFGYLAIRAMLGLPLSMKNFTGVNAPKTGGALYQKTKIE